MVTTALSLRDAWASYLRHLRAAGRAPRTLKIYTQGLDAYDRYREAQGWPGGLADVTRERLEGWIAWELEGHRAQTAQTYYRALNTFFRWLVDEGEIEKSPMARMRAPRVEISPPPILSDADLVKLLRACAGRDFTERRDSAILWLLIDTGMRAGELCGLTLDALDLDLQVARVAAGTSKSRRGRAVPFGAKTSAALDRYLRVRGGHTFAADPHLFLGLRGPVTTSGLYQILKGRGAQAGLESRIFTHLLRHTMAHRWLSAGGGELDLQTIAGWSDGTMLARYGASARGERAREAHRRLGPADRLKV
jgi:site-specific recombinase XerD